MPFGRFRRRRPFGLRRRRVFRRFRTGRRFGGVRRGNRVTRAIRSVVESKTFFLDSGAFSIPSVAGGGPAQQLLTPQPAQGVSSTGRIGNRIRVVMMDMTATFAGVPDPGEVNFVRFMIVRSKVALTSADFALAVTQFNMPWNQERVPVYIHMDRLFALSSASGGVWNQRAIRRKMRMKFHAHFDDSSNLVRGFVYFMALSDSTIAPSPTGQVTVRSYYQDA